MTDAPRWHRFDLVVEHEPALEIRAEPNGRGGWTIRAERTMDREGVMLFGYLQASPQDYAITLGDADSPRSPVR
jgi:hypothetical protein